MLEDTAPIVQLSYSWQALLISSEKRTLLWNFHSEGMIQVGQKERKRYGALFLSAARIKEVRHRDKHHFFLVMSKFAGVAEWLVRWSNLL